MELKGVARSLYGCGVALLFLGVLQLCSFAYVAAALSIAGGALLVDFTFSDDAMRARLQGTAPGCMCRKTPSAGSARAAMHVRDCCAPSHAFGLMISVIVFSVLSLIQSLALASLFGRDLPYWEAATCGNYPGDSAFRTQCPNYIYGPSSYSYYSECNAWYIYCYRSSYYPSGYYSSSTVSYYLGFYRYIIGTGAVSAICCVGQLVAASVALARLNKLQRLAHASMPHAVNLPNSSGCCGGCCGGGQPTTMMGLGSGGPAIMDPNAAAAVRVQMAMAAAYPPGHWAGPPVPQMTGLGMQVPMAVPMEALHTEGGAVVSRSPFGGLGAGTCAYDMQADKGGAKHSSASA